MKPLFLTLLIVLSQSIAAAIVCETPRESKMIEIGLDKVTIKDHEDFGAARVVASINRVRTKNEGSGFTKVLFHSGSKHIIHVGDKNNFSELDDYLIIRSDEGHEITYPLHCKN